MLSEISQGTRVKLPSEIYRPGDLLPYTLRGIFRKYALLLRQCTWVVVSGSPVVIGSSVVPSVGPAEVVCVVCLYGSKNIYLTVLPFTMYVQLTEVLTYMSWQHKETIE